MVNYLAVIVASIVGYIIPMLWYTVIFGKQWLKLMKITPKDKANMKMPMSTIIIGFLATLIFNYVLAWVIGYSGAATFIAGATIGGILWVGFIATTMINGVLYEKKPVALYWLNSICYLVCMLIAGGILAVWQ